MVDSPRYSCWAISWLDRPWAQSFSTSFSRGVSTRKSVGLRDLGLAGERCDQAPGHRRGEQGVAGGDGVHAGDERLRCAVLEQEAAGACPDGVEHVFVKVVCREDEHMHPGDRLARSGGWLPGRPCSAS